MMARGPYVFTHEGIKPHARRAESIQEAPVAFDFLSAFEAAMPEWSRHPRRHCRFEDPRLFSGENQAIGAKEICPGCPVIKDCLEHALINGEYGAWGGTTDTERKYR